MNLSAAVLPALPVFVRAFPPLVPDAVRLLQRMFDSCCAHNPSVCVRAEQLALRGPSTTSAPYASGGTGRQLYTDDSSDYCNDENMSADSALVADDGLAAADSPENRLAHMLLACFHRVVRCSPLLRPFL